MVKRCLLLLFALLSVSGFAQTVDPDIYAGMKWRLVGPFRGGRSLAVSGSTQRPKEYYFGAAGGGVWKTTDGGENWTPVSDGYLTMASVGAVAVAPSNPDVVYAGTGERDIRGDISEGDGLYKTVDGGKTWVKAGLAQTRTIGRIVVHPTDPNTVYVAALGPIYTHPGVADSNARGVFKTTDGGLTWTNVLPPPAPRTGAVHLVMDPSNANVLLAATWEAWRSPWTMNSGGAGSKLFKTTDAGKTWQELSSKPGMPSGPLGKMGFAISPADPNRYYAQIEAHEGGLYRSDDAGNTWTLANDSRNWRQRAWYYTHVAADPKDKDTVYAMNVGMGRSRDGGKTFQGMGTPHSDNHDLWIAPDDPNRMIQSNDGGANVSTDGGRTWTEQDFPTAQIYHVSTDNAFPYRILGAQQDNSTIRIASRTQGPGIRNTDWTSTAGGESGYVAAKPNDPDIVFGGNYSGSLEMTNHRTGESRSVDPWPLNPMGHGAIDLVQRFQWTYPIVFSPNDPNTLYTCSQFVLKSTNMGQSWTKISPDLTRNDPATLGSSGGPITKDNTGVEYYGTVFTLAESPVKRGVIWAGSDDGLIHVTQDGGKTWRNVTPTMPKWALVSMIEASPFDAGTAYAAVDNHENNDYSPYAFKTTDYGRTWTKITRGIPDHTFFRVVREDRKRKGLLYGGTETGAYVSFDGGAQWQTLQMNLPVTPVHDFAWKDDDLIAATHGRSFWVLDDVTPLQQVQPGSLATTKFFAPKDAYRVRWGGAFGGGRGGGSEPMGQNPLSGVVLNYYLPKDAQEVRFEIRDAKGEVVATVGNAPKTKGFQRTSSFLQYPSWRPVQGMIMWGASPRPILAPPGQYTVTMTVDGAKQEHKFRWLKDPRSSASDRDLVEQFEFQRRIARRVDEANDVVLKIRTVRAALDKATESVDSKNVPDLKARMVRVRGDLTSVEEAIYQTKNRSGQDPLNYPIRLNNQIGALIGTVATGDFKPTAQSYEVFELLSKQLDAELARLKSLEGEIKAVNAELLKLGVPQIPF